MSGPYTPAGLNPDATPPIGTRLNGSRTARNVRFAHAILPSEFKSQAFPQRDRLHACKIGCILNSGI